MEYIATFVLAALIGLGVALFRALRKLNLRDNEQESDLEEWVCPECGFTVQAGSECIYCYTKKPR
jgi:rubrerythrin